MSENEPLKDRLDELFSTPPDLIAPGGLPLVIFQQAFEHMALGMAITGVDGRFKRVNPTFCAILGYAMSEVEGRSFQSLTHPEDLSIGGDAMRAMLSGQSQTANIQKRYLHKDGPVVWADLNITLVRDAAGQPLYFVTVIQDIGDQKRTAALLEKRVRELRCLNDIGHRIDEKPPLDEFFEWLCQRIPSAFQYPEFCVAAVEYRGKLSGHPDAAEPDAARPAMVGGLRIGGELFGWLRVAFRTDSPPDLHFADAESALLGGIVSRACGYIESLALARQAAERLKEMQIFRYSLERTTDAVFLTDLEGKITYANPAFEKMYGYSVQEALGQTPRILKSGKLSAAEYQRFWATLLARQTVAGEIINRTRDGRFIPVEGANTPVLDEAGDVLGYLAVHRDITARKQAEQELRQLADTNAARSRELGILNEMGRALTAAMATGEVLQTVYQYASKLMDTSSLFVALYDPATDQISFPLAYSADQALHLDSYQLSGSGSGGLTEYIIRRRASLLLSQDVDAGIAALGIAAVFYGDDLPALSWLGVPLLYGDQILGVIALQSVTTPGLYGNHERGLLEVIASQAANAFAIARQYRETQVALADASRSQALLRSIIDATPDWIFIKDRQHRYRLVNRGYAGALHFEPDAMLGKDDLELGFPEELVRGDPEKGIRGFWADDRLVFESGQTQVYPEDPAAIDGQIHIFHTFKIPLRDEDDQVWGLLAFARDVSERAELLVAAERQSAALARLSQAARQLSEAGSLAEILRQAGASLLEMLAGARASVALLDPDGQTFEILAVSGLDVIPTGRHLPVAGTAIGACIRDNRPTLLSGEAAMQPYLDARLLAGQGIRTTFNAPMTSAGRVIGSLNLAGLREDAFDAFAQTVVTQLAALTGSAMQSRRLLETLQQRAGREQSLREIASQVRSSLDADTILRTAARQLGETLGRKTYVRLAPTPAAPLPPEDDHPA